MGVTLPLAELINPAGTVASVATQSHLATTRVWTGNLVNESGAGQRGPWVWELAGVDFGAGPTTDPVMRFGYNLAAGGLVTAGEPGVALVIEGNYDDGSGHNKVETYEQFQDSTGAVTLRPWFFQIDRSVHALTNALVTGSAVVGYPFGVQEPVNYGSATFVATFGGANSLMALQPDPNGSQWYVTRDGRLVLNPSGAGLTNTTVDGSIIASSRDVGGATPIVTLNTQPAQSGDVLAVVDHSNNMLSRINKAGRYVTKVGTIPALGDLADGETSLWVDAATGNLKITSRVGGALKNATVVVV